MYVALPMTQVDVADFTYLTRIRYKAESDSIWGEHEIDYILFLQKDLPCSPNPNEVMSCKYVDQKEMREMLNQAAQGKVKITPWFKIICETFLFKWWDSLHSLSTLVDESSIHNMT